MKCGFDHGAGHPLLFLDDVKVPNCQKNNEFDGLGNYSDWPKVAGAVIQARIRAIAHLSGIARDRNARMLPSHKMAISIETPDTRCLMSTCEIPANSLQN